MKWRSTRFPSGWAMTVSCAWGDFPIRVRNVSQTGLRFEGELPAPAGEEVRFRVLGQPIVAKVVRRDQHQGALHFQRPLTAAQMETLRQFRAIACGW